MAIQRAAPALRKVNHRVEDMSFASDVDVTGMCFCDWGDAYVTLDVDGILAATSITTAGSTTTMASTYSRTAMGRYGRNLTVVASGTATSAVVVYGYDYLGQYMAESFTLTSATPVVGVKCFAEVTNVTWTGTSAITINLGWGNNFGLPYKAISTTILHELVSNAVPTAGALVVGALAQAITAGTVDPRGYYTPQASYVSDGTRTHKLTYRVDLNEMHGTAHVAS